MRGIVELNLVLAGDDGIEFITTFGSAAGQKQRFVPDSTKGFLQFEIANAFPNALVYGTAIHPTVLAKSYGSMLHQPFNLEHQLAHYKKKPGIANHAEDRILGSIHGVNFPETPHSGWRVSADPSKAPKITAVASYSKLAKGMDDVLGEHASGKHRYTVSMEANYQFNNSGFAIARGNRAPLKGFESTTPEDMAMAGYDYVPVEQAPDDLASLNSKTGYYESSVFDKEKGFVVSNYRGRKVTLMMNGLDKPVHFAGVGLVKYGAESKAGINRMLASADAPTLLIEPFKGLTDFLLSLQPAKKL